MKIIPFYYNDIDDLCSNTYLLIDNKNNCVIIDPSKDSGALVNYLIKNNLTPVAILLTHGHIDHFKGAKHIISTFDTPLYISFLDKDFLGDSHLNCSKYLGEENTIDIIPITLVDKEVIKLLEEDIVALATPYHTAGSMCFYIKSMKVLFSGDSLFKGNIGRYDLPTGNRKEIFASLTKIFNLDLDTKVYPGHGPTTYLKDEKDIIKFVKGL